MNILKFIIVINYALVYVICDIIQLNNMQVTSKLSQIPLNTVTKIKRFVFIKSPNNIYNSGLNYSFTIINNSSTLTNILYFYLIKSDSIPNIDFINNPSVKLVLNRSVAHHTEEYYVMNIQTLMKIIVITGLLYQTSQSLSITVLFIQEKYLLMNQKFLFLMYNVISLEQNS